MLEELWECLLDSDSLVYLTGLSMNSSKTVENLRNHRIEKNITLAGDKI